MVGSQGQVSGRVEECIDSGGHSATTAVSQDNNEPQAASQVIDRVSQAAKYIVADSIAGNPDHEQVVRSFVEDQFDRHAGVGAAKHRREGALFGQDLFARLHNEVTCIDLDDATHG